MFKTLISNKTALKNKNSKGGNDKIKKLSAVVNFFMLIIVVNIYASSLDLGNKPLALGSAYTAVGGDVYSLYVNPAGLCGGRSFDLKLDLLAGVDFTGNILHNANQIVDSAIKFEKIRQAQQQGGSVDVTQIAAFFNGIKNLLEMNQPGKGVLLQLNGGVGVKVKNFAFSVRNITDVGLKPTIDNDFLLGNVNTSTGSTLCIGKNLYFSNGANNGIVITTGTLNDPSLIDARDKLRDKVVPWLVQELEKLGVAIPPEIKNNAEGIANALINLSVQQNVSYQEIRDAVDLLANEELQNFISNYINQIQYGQTQPFSHNNSGLIFKGVNYTEFTLGYSYKFFDRVLVGASLKYLLAKTLYYHLKIFEQSEKLNPDFLRDTISSRLEKTYTAVGLDLGAIYELPIPVVKTNAGVVIKNLIEPRFDIEGTNDDIKLPRQIKLGLSCSLWKRIAVIVDYDLNEIETLLPGYKIQNIAVGVELDPPILPVVRLGYRKNLKSENDYIYAAGLGIKILLLNLDIVCVLRPDEIKIDKDYQPLPSNLNLGLTLGIRF